MAILHLVSFTDALKNKKNPTASGELRPPDPLLQRFTIVFSTSPHEILDPPLFTSVVTCQSYLHMKHCSIDLYFKLKPARHSNFPIIYMHVFMYYIHMYSYMVIHVIEQIEKVLLYSKFLTTYISTL